jgi:hypothetical protein
MSLFGIFRVNNVNKNARIESRVCRNGKLRTETARRDDGVWNAAVTTDPQTNATNLFLDLEDGTTVKLSGREARTLYLLLSKHYDYRATKTLV